MIVVGTSLQLSSAMKYIDEARRKGARIVTVDLTAEDDDHLDTMQAGDFAFARDAAEALPLMFEPIIGKLQADGSYKKE